MHEFTQRDADEFNYVAVDIETTGFLASDNLTTLTLNHAGQMVVFAQTPNGDTEYLANLETPLAAHTDENVTVKAASDENELLEAVREYALTNFRDDTILCAYNGELWNGGFDLAFLRTACDRHDVEFVFKDFPYTDVQEVFKKKGRFNTEVPSISGGYKDDLVAFAEMHGLDSDGKKDDLLERIEDAEPTPGMVREWAVEHNDGEVPRKTVTDLDGVYELLNTPEITYDPFDGESELAVEAFEQGNLKSVCLHNIADVRKTAVLMEKVVKQVPQYDYRPKWL